MGSVSVLSAKQTNPPIEHTNTIDVRLYVDVYIFSFFYFSKLKHCQTEDMGTHLAGAKAFRLPKKVQLYNKSIKSLSLIRNFVSTPGIRGPQEFLV